MVCHLCWWYVKVCCDMIHIYIYRRHNIAFTTILVDLKVYMLLLFDKQSRKGRYTNTVNLLRKYFGDFLIATYLNAVQESRYDDGYISGIEVWFSSWVCSQSLFGHKPQPNYIHVFVDSGGHSVFPYMKHICLFKHLQLCKFGQHQHFPVCSIFFFETVCSIFDIFINIFNSV